MAEEARQYNSEKTKSSEQMTAKELKNYMRATQEEDETVANVPPMERTIAVLGPNGTTPGRQQTTKAPQVTPANAISLADNNTVGSSLTGNTRESKVRRAVEERDRQHAEELKKRDDEMAAIKKQLASVLNLVQAQATNPGAGQSATNG